jgi:protein-S-isoprenylcysteine O-methyltransferase Ste14
MRLISWTEVLVCWFAWLYPFIFRAPHVQKRESITVPTPTRIGLFLECTAITLAFAFRTPAEPAPAIWRMAASAVCIAVAGWLAWTSVTHLGRQFRVHAGLYHDHALVTTGPYAIVRHPIYASLLMALGCTLLLLTRWPWTVISLVVFIIGTEIRVHSEEVLLGGRFGGRFKTYRKAVPAYLPFVR